MLTTGIQNLPEPLARTQAAYHYGTGRLVPASADRLARRVEHFASSVQFVLDDPDAARRLHALTKDLRTVTRLGSLLPQVLRGAMTLTPHREIAAAAGFRAVQSTPLVDYAGHLIGMVSTHFQRPQRPSDRDLRIMELYADFAGEALTRHLGLVSGSDPPGPVGRAMVSALLDPARAREADVSVPFELWVIGRMTASFARRARPTWAERSAHLTGFTE
jgi:hypothetical protein